MDPQIMNNFHKFTLQSKFQLFLSFANLMVPTIILICILGEYEHLEIAFLITLVFTKILWVKIKNILIELFNF